MRISDWSSDVCSSDLSGHGVAATGRCRQGRVDEQAGGRHGAQTALMETSADKLSALLLALALHELGRASCRERVCQYVYISVVAVSLKKTMITHHSS